MPSKCCREGKAKAQKAAQAATDPPPDDLRAALLKIRAESNRSRERGLSE